MVDIPTPTQVALVRRRYLEAATLRAIKRETGIASSEMLNRCLDGEFDDGSGTLLQSIPRRRSAARVQGRSRGRRALVARLWRAAERQVEEIETRLKAAGLEVAERESNARALAIMVKTLRELAAFDAAQKARTKEAAADDDDAVPRDMDEFRRELSRRIDALAAARAQGGAGRGTA